MTWQFPWQGVRKGDRRGDWRELAGIEDEGHPDVDVPALARALEFGHDARGALGERRMRRAQYLDGLHSAVHAQRELDERDALVEPRALPFDRQAHVAIHLAADPH